MPPRYFLRCLGTPELRGPTGEPIRFRTRKHMALLVYLAVEPRQAHRRDRLADLLWPGASLPEARHSLATALSVIRGKLGPRTWESTRDTIRLIAPDFEVDLERLGRGEILGDEVTPPIEMGGFLDDFDVIRAPEYMMWRDQTRAQWWPAIRKGFIVLMDRCRRTGAFARIEPLADRLLILDALSEEGIRAKMEGRAFAGDRISALRIFQEWRARLVEELGAVPSPTVEGMALRLRQRGYEPPGTAHIPTVPTDQWRDRAFIGRANQYCVVYEQWEHTGRHEGRHALVLGDSGIGKTTLVERLVTAAGLEGAVSSRVQCYEVEREIPYAAIGTLVRGMLDRPGATATPPEWLSELARTIPAVAQRFQNLAPARDSEGETARLRLTEGVHQLATAIADEHPLILVVDDVHLSDDASVAVLHLLMRRTQQQRIMIVLTARQAELNHSPHASRLMDARRALALAPVELPPLTLDEMKEVVNALAAAAGAPLPPAVHRALLRASAGIPMVAELLFDDWRIHGEQCLALSVGAMTVDAQGAPDADLFSRLLDRVMQNLTPAALAVLNLAAILGDRLNDLTMYELVDLTLAQTLAGMSELTSHRILRDGGRELEFRNELLRGQAYLNVPSPLRRALHSLIANRLLAAIAKGEAVPGLMLAWHCYRAGRETEAYPHLIRGSQEALDRGAPFETELALQSALPALRNRARDQARVLYCKAIQEQGRWIDSLTYLRSSEEWSLESLEKKVAMELYAKASITPDPVECRGLLNEASALIRDSNDSSTALTAVLAAVRLTYYLSDQDFSSDLLNSIGKIAGMATDLSTRVIIAQSTALISWHAHSLADFQEYRRSLACLSEECQSVGMQSSVRFALENVRGCVETSCGDYSAGLRAFLQAHSTARTIGDDERESFSAANAAMCYGRLGQYEDQRVWSEKALSIPIRAGSGWRAFRAQFCLAWSYAMVGNTRKALEGITQEHPTSGTIPIWLIQTRGLLKADIYQLCGEHRQAALIAADTILASGMVPASGSAPGSLGRWLAITSVKGPELTGSREALRDLALAATDLDLIDQAEVIGAWIWLKIQNGEEVLPEEKAPLLDALKILPSATSLQLYRLGVAVP